MMPSRGMGDINSSKMPKARTITRKDDPNKVKVFKAGGKSRCLMRLGQLHTNPE
jgi:hypothetical protein